jgi:hypothetical protein
MSKVQALAHVPAVQNANVKNGQELALSKVTRELSTKIEKMAIRREF